MLSRSLLTLALLAAGIAGAYEPAEELCVLDHPQIRESSGVVAASYSDDLFFTHNDSGDLPRLFAFDRTCRVLATINVTGADANDWEDIARGPGPGGAQHLFIGDFGNNNRTRRSLVVYEVPEPIVAPTGEHRILSIAVVARHDFTYDDGPQDAEGMFVDPTNADVYIISKTSLSLSTIYRLERVLPGPAPLIATSVARVVWLPPPPPALPVTLIPQATGADIAPDGSRIAIRTYQDAYEWMVPAGGIAAAFDAAPQRIRLPFTQQGEAIGYTRDGGSLLTTTEGAGPVHLLAGS